VSEHVYRRLARAAALATAAATVLAAVTTVTASAASGRAGGPARPSGPGGFRAACPPARPGYMRCFALYRPQTVVNAALAAGLSARPAGLTPRQIRSAYRLPARGGTGQTVAVSIAYHAPHLAQNLARYRAFFHLPACTTASGCLRIVNQHGRPGPLPRSVVPGWALEETLDVSMISAACPHCRILVVEASQASSADLGATENTAARLGARVISNSYGIRENGAAQATAADWRHPGHAIVAAAGDSGFTAADFPANLASVTAVGGTQLTRAPRTRRGWAEQVLNQPHIVFGGIAGSSGCSAYVAKPAWQHDRHCPGRTVADVSAVGVDVPVYDKSFGGWVTVAGTSVAAPLIAGIYGLAGNAATIRPGRAYARRRALFDITRGNNALLGTVAQLCGGDYLCVAKPGYDAPTGLGTPDGTGAF
jgi:subtilase family serine protease